MLSPIASMLAQVHGFAPRIKRRIANPPHLSRFWLLILFVMVAAGCEPARAQSSEADEYRVKAAFLYHFIQLVDWPAGSLGDAVQPLSLCTIGDDAFHGELENSVDGKVVDGRFIRVRHLKKIQEGHNCQILLFARAEEKQFIEMLMELGNGPILTVGESDQFAEQGGMIQFVLDDNKVRFDINVGAAQKSGLKISSKLLLLAKEVIGNRGGK